jgi:P-type E1-E2 ATPase
MLVGVVLFFALKNHPDTAFNRAIAMLVIACPSALILATPTAMVAGLSAAARLGVLVKSVATLEAARGLSAIVFDKTGTLTTGVLAVTRLSPEPGVEPGELLAAAAAAEQNSRHPVARAVTEMARRARVRLTATERFEEVAGKGVIAGLGDGSTVLVGRASWLAETVPTADREALEAVQASSDTEGLSVLHVFRDGRPLGWIGLEDNARPEAAGAVDRLRRMGISRLVLLTGDRASVARRVAGQMHFDEFKAEVLPHEKLEMVDTLKGAGHRVAVIGDGVNDAAALRKADVGVAMGGRGTDVAREAADVVLQDDAFPTIGAAIEEGRLIFDNIRKFVFYLFSCNLAEIGVLLGAGLVGAMPLLPIQILWLNLVTDTFPALALAVEPAESNAMARPPRDPGATILSRRFVLAITWHAVLLATATLVAWGWAMHAGPALASTVAFMTLALAQLFHLGTARSHDAVVTPARAVANPWALAAVALVVALQILSVSWQPLQAVLDTTPLTPAAWLVTLAAAATPGTIGQAIRLRRASRHSSGRA